jgi:hypothetical protein
VRPASDKFIAAYRIGNDVRGNLGRDALTHLVSDAPAIITDLVDPLILEVRNPLPAQRGIRPESIEELRRNAPSAFRMQERAVAGGLRRSHRALQSQCATSRRHFSLNGSWRTVFLTVDRLGGEEE